MEIISYVAYFIKYLYWVRKNSKLDCATDSGTLACHLRFFFLEIGKTAKIVTMFFTMSGA